MTNYLTLSLGLIMFSLLICLVLIIPFINLLYKLRLTRKKEAPEEGEIPLHKNNYQGKIIDFKNKKCNCNWFLGWW